MNSIDLVTMLGNLSQSLYPLQRFISGGAYILGILFFITALTKLKTIARGRSQEKTFVPMMYFMFGAALLYLPTAISSLANTAFGVGNVLTYTDYNRANIFSSMGLIIRTAGLLWFVRGTVLVAHASQPGAKDGPKGLVFLVAGVFAMNFDNTIAMINSVLSHIIAWSLSVKSSQGY